MKRNKTNDRPILLSIITLKACDFKQLIGEAILKNETDKPI